jgi:Zn-finger nucleic acid-binding protein
MSKTRKCEHCGKDINVIYNVCPICGGELEEYLDPLPPECPRCKEPLELHRGDDGQEYEMCPRCSGLWIDREVFPALTRGHPVKRQGGYRGTYRKTPDRGPLEYIPCVRCGKLMNRKNFKRISGVIIDECRRHGVWLDAGELEKIRHFIANGGLEMAMEREIERNRARIRELATKVDQTAFTQKVIHFWNLKRWLFG